MVAHKILVSAPVPLELILTGLGLGLGGLGFGTGLDNISLKMIRLQVLITPVCRLCICEKAHILFHPEDATLNQRSEFFSKCWHKDKHLLKNN